MDPSLQPRPTIRAIGARAVWAGAIGGAAAGAIDFLWSAGQASQFATGIAKVRALLYLSFNYGLASAIALPLIAAFATIFWRFTRAGETGSALATIGADKPIARACLAFAIPLSVIVTVGLVFATLLPSLSTRKHLGLVIAVAMIATLIAIAIGIAIGFVVGKFLEALLVRIGITKGPSTQVIALLAVFGLTLALAAIGWRARATLGLLTLRPLASAALIALLSVASLPFGQRLASWTGQTRFASFVVPGFIGVLAMAMLALGISDRARKAATHYSGLGAPLTVAFQKVFDLDRDGFSRALGGGDCDDWNRSVHPDAPELPDDGIDNNCVGGDVTLARDPDDAAFAPLPAGLPADFNVVLITIDTLRADHLGSYGYQRATSPALDALAAAGTVFENSWAHAPSTRYSIPAILTGRHPLSVDTFPIDGAWPGLAESNTTIAEVLKARGLVTMAVLNYWYFEERRRMNQGFDSYDNSNRRLHRAVGGKGPAQTSGSSSKEQTDNALKAIDKAQTTDTSLAERFFLWVHYYDPHYSYEKHPGTTEFGPDKVALYDHEIRYTDDQIGRLIEGLKSRGLYEKTVFVVTGDHGEGFGEHGIDLHGYHLYAAQTKVPLIIRVPGVPPSRVVTPVVHADILPTLANLAGAEPSAEMEGRSLLDLISGPEAEIESVKDRVVFQQLSFENNNETRAAASRDCHVIFNVSPNRSWETYNLSSDSAELRDLTESGACSAVRHQLERFYDRSEIPKDAAVSLLAEPPSVASPLNATFGSSAKLLEVELPATVKRGGTAMLTFTWEALGTFSKEWKVFVHLEGPQKAFAQADHQPARPFRWWKHGQFIRYQRPLKLNRSLRVGTYKVWLGLFRSSTRHPVAVSGRPAADNRVLVGTIEVVQ